MSWVWQASEPTTSGPFSIMWNCPGLMDTPKSAKVSAEGVNGREGRKLTFSLRSTHPTLRILHRPEAVSIKV
jgi:hypothetical protein